MPPNQNNQLEDYKSWGVPPPEHTPHGTDDEIRNKMVYLLPNSWTLQGNKLSGMTPMGRLVVFIPTDRILTGTDDEGLPIFKKIDNSS